MPHKKRSLPFTSAALNEWCRQQIWRYHTSTLDLSAFDEYLALDTRKWFYIRVPNTYSHLFCKKCRRCVSFETIVKGYHIHGQ